ncbi:MAG TPA: hypothetical protein VEQ42_07485 [Pyrinomonadaceae bacterium]|nr:hypothetical protein [Pyrinomonadaceae bacterium]
MNADAGQAELIFVLALMFLILVFGLVAVFVFFRVWRKERAAKAESEASKPEAGSPTPE